MTSTWHPNWHSVPAEDYFLDYTAGVQGINWGQWLDRDELGASDTSADPDFILNPREESHEVDSDASSECPSIGHIIMHSFDSDDDSLDDNLDDNHRPVTDADMGYLRLLALFTYPSGQFVHLPLFQHWVSHLSKEDALAILQDAWKLNEVIATVSTTITGVTTQHPDAAIQQTLQMAIQSLSGLDINRTLGITAILQARDVHILRGYVIEALSQLGVEDILSLIAPNGLDGAEVTDLYNSAVLHGLIRGFEFGFESQPWSNDLSDYVLLSWHEQELLAPELRGMMDWPNFEYES
ncbi:hypothetical protein BDV06DRAFT_224069 [Aspergillus oleicola]